jgi:hypothetical protein
MSIGFNAGDKEKENTGVYMCELENDVWKVHGKRQENKGNMTSS